MERLTYRDNSGRALLTHFGKQMYCSTQATADCVCKLEECLEDAISMLKAQAPRVLTLDEVINYDGPVYITWNDPESGCWAICPPIVKAMARTRPEWDVMHFGGGTVNQLKAHYGRTWRAWTSRPTDEQRKAVPWPC